MKYMNVVINVNPNLARIFLYHAIGTSLSLWVFTIIHETADAIAEIDAGMLLIYCIYTHFKSSKLCTELFHFVNS